MLAKIIFCSAVSLATLAILLLAVLSPVPYKQHATTGSPKPLVALSLYIQQPRTAHNMNHGTVSSARALTFHRMLTEGPESTSIIVGKAQGFFIPVEKFAHSSFNIIYLSFSTPEYSGSLSIQAKELGYKAREELKVVGGTGSFAFARGVAVVLKANERFSDVNTPIYQVNLQLSFPSR